VVAVGRPVVNWDFRGRAREVAALEAGWLASGGYEGAPILVVYGEPGIGKTRTVAEFARSVRARGAEVLWGSCYEGGSTRPYGVWVEAIGGYLNRLGDAGLQEALGSDGHWLAPLVPEGFLPDRAPVGVPAVVARLRLAEVLARMLESMPLRAAVILDDLQWADAESLELFGHVARLAPRCLIVVIFRGSGLELGHPLARRLAEVARQRSCEYLPLSSLPRREGGRLLEEAAGRPLDVGLVDALYEQSGGNPFFLGELGRYLLSYGELTKVAGGGRPVPESIRGAVGLRVAGLSAETRRMLQLASVFTAGFGFVELEALTDIDEGSLLDCVEEALTEELLFPLDAERYDFVHALVRQTLYEQMSSSRRARVHRRLAEALERLHESDPTPVAAELVRQYHASVTLAGAERGAVHALTAGQAARAACAPADAVMTLRLGMDLVAAEDAEARGRLLSELALAEAETGLFSEAARTLDAAVSLLEQGEELGEERGEAIAELVYAVGEAFWVAPAGSLAIDPLVERAVTALGQQRNLAWARLKLLDRYVAPDTFGPIGVLGWTRFDPEAVRIAREQGTEADYANTLNGWFPWFGAEVEQLITRVTQWHDPGARMQALIPTVGYLTLLEPGRSAASTDRLCAELHALADDVGLLPHRAVVRTFRATLLGGRGEFEAAASQLREARDLFSGLPPARSSEALVTLVEELTKQHVEADWPRVAGVMWNLARSPEHFAGWLSLGCAAFAAHANAHTGDVDRAREILGYILPALCSDDPLTSTASNAIGLAGDAVWELRAVDFAERLLPYARTLADVDPRAFYMTSSELTVARLSAVTGRLDQAVEYFARARVTLERDDQRVLRAIVDYDEALTRIEHHKPGARRFLDAAGARFQDLGMREWSRRLMTVDAPDRELPDALTAREAEILRLVAARRTNKEIAAQLVLSVHTVERHVQNAYRKVGANNRLDASDYVARVDL
jgi:DNA-binding CsgD family transcriptional regulator